MKNRSVEAITTGHPLTVGAMSVRQPLPTQRLDQVDPFILLHHFGPVHSEPGTDPLDLGPHPHRGFEPVTFLYRGGLRHRDSRGNTGHLKGGDVQWMTAGMGIIHSERASDDFLRQGGVLEGIQLWVNLPASHKMAPPRYQDVKSEDIPALAYEGAQVQVVAGSFGGVRGPVETYTPILALKVELQAGGQVQIPLPESHNALVYFLTGSARLNDNWDYEAETLLSFRRDGEGISLQGLAPFTEALILGGEPLNEPVAQWGPYVMNTQSELLEAMRDYQMGRMGVYIED